jgi:hypothetical protein
MARTIPWATLASLVAAFAFAFAAAAEEPPYEGRKKCSSCHKSQIQSWQKTAHGQAFKSLEEGEKTEAKKRAGLDPDKDYTEDKKCVGCHTTGFGFEDGYDIDDPSTYLVNVTCESCHGPGSKYQFIHREAAERFESQKETKPRQDLVDAGEEFHFVERCNACHMNYEGSPWPGAKPPYTPFTPKVDAKYAFDFEKAVRDDKAMHEHFKLDGVFTGPPLPPFHDEFQAKAKPTVAE